jgi:hypothetical protein
MARVTGKDITRPMSRNLGKKQSGRKGVLEAKLDALIEEATVDAYDESEQMTGFHTMLDEHLEMPFQTHVLGVEVTAEQVDLTDDSHIVVVCRRGKWCQRIPLLDLPLPKPPPQGAE